MCVALLRVYSLVISAGNVCEELCEIVLYSQMRTCTAKRHTVSKRGKPHISEFKVLRKTEKFV